MNGDTQQAPFIGPGHDGGFFGGIPTGGFKLGDTNTPPVRGDIEHPFGPSNTPPFIGNTGTPGGFVGGIPTGVSAFGVIDQP